MTREEAIEVIEKERPKACKMVDGRLVGGFPDKKVILVRLLIWQLMILKSIYRKNQGGKAMDILQMALLYMIHGFVLTVKPIMRWIMTIISIVRIADRLF